MHAFMQCRWDPTGTTRCDHCDGHDRRHLYVTWTFPLSTVAHWITDTHVWAASVITADPDVHTTVAFSCLYPWMRRVMRRDDAQQCGRALRPWMREQYILWRSTIVPLDNACRELPIEPFLRGCADTDPHPAMQTLRAFTVWNAERCAAWTREAREHPTAWRARVIARLQGIRNFWAQALAHTWVITVSPTRTFHVHHRVSSLD